MDKQKTLAEAIGEILGRTTVGAITAPIKFQKWKAKTAKAIAKAAFKAGGQGVAGYKKGITTPVGQAEIMPFMDENVPAYLGRTLGQNQRAVAKTAFQTIPRAVGRGLYNLGEAEMGLAQGMQRGVASTPEYQQAMVLPRAVQQRVASAMPQRRPLPTGYLNEPAQRPNPINSFSDALRQQIMMNLMAQ